MEKADLLKMVIATYFREGELFLPPVSSFSSHVLLQPCMQVRRVLAPWEAMMGSYKVTYLGHKQQMSEKGMREHEPQPGAAQGSKLVTTQQGGRLDR